MATAIHGSFRRNEPMSRHSTWRAGGTADVCFEPADRESLCRYLSETAADEPLLWVGFGSNLLVRDGGVRGTVIAIGHALSRIEIHADGAIEVQAGAATARVARESARAGLTGAEFMCGIPGSIGGALAMNAGAYGCEIWTIVESVETVDRAGNVHVRTPRDFDIAYRHVRGPVDEGFIAARLQLQPADVEACLATIRRYLDDRARTQPVGQPSCGSVFRNPAGDYAGRLIEAAGLKGHRLGGCHVSTRHANFIVNDRNATAGDIEALIRHVRSAVHAHAGVWLEPEVRIVGEPLDPPAAPAGAGAQTDG